MYINPHIFRSYDIRGVVGEDLDEQKVEALGRAYGTFLRKRNIRQAVVGRDSRSSGPAFKQAFIQGLRMTGVSVYDLDLCMINMLYSAQYYLQVNGGAMITASHNPAQYNGFKLAIGFSATTGTEELQEIRTILETEQYFVSNRLGVVVAFDYTELYMRDILKRIELKKSYTVVVDAGHGAAGTFVPQLLEKSGCTVIGQHLEPDGTFPAGTPDPTETHMLERLRERVLSEGADIGVAYDADGDRIGVVDEKGNLIWSDVLVALFAQEIIGRFPGAKIVYNTLCSQVVKKTIEHAGGEPIMWLTGHAHIKQKLSQERAVFGGELSGHFFFADNFYGHDDGCFAFMRVLEYMSKSGKSLHELHSALPQYVSSPEIKIACPDEDKRQVIERISKYLRTEFADACITDERTIPGNDGVRIDFEDGMMIFRYSHNGPYITVKFEAQDERTYTERRNYVKSLLKQQPEMIWKGDLSINLEALG